LSDSQGNYLGAISCLVDITERKLAEETLAESEERFRTLADSNPMIIWVTDSLGADRFVNRTACEYFGVSLEQPEGFKWKSFMNPDDATAYLDAFTHAVETHASFKAEVRMRRKDGEWRWMSSYAVPRFSDSGEFLGHVGNSEDVTEKKNAHAQLQESLQQLHALSGHLQTIREEERASIAREIHDSLGQSLTGLKMDLVWWRDRMDKQADSIRSPAAATKLTTMLSDVDQSIDTVRQIATDLRPSLLDTMGLVPAIEWLTNDFQKRFGVISRFRCQSPVESLPDYAEFSIAVYRICQEALTNVARHAHANHVNVGLSIQDQHLVLQVEDDGVGFTLEKATKKTTFGILDMRERALRFQGTIRFERPAQGGTRVVARLSIPATDRNGETGLKEEG